MTRKRFIASTRACALVCAVLITTQGERRGSISAAAGRQGTGQPAGASQQPGGGQRGGGGGGGDAPVLGPGTLIDGAWGADPCRLMHAAGAG